MRRVTVSIMQAASIVLAVLFAAACADPSVDEETSQAVDPLRRPINPPLTCSSYATSWTTVFSKANTYPNFGPAEYIDPSGTIYLVNNSNYSEAEASVLESSDSGATWTTHPLPVSTASVSQILGDAGGTVYVIAQDYATNVIYVFKGTRGSAFTQIDEVLDAVVVSNMGGPTQDPKGNAKVDAAGLLSVAEFQRVQEGPEGYGTLVIRSTSNGGSTWTTTEIESPHTCSDGVYPGAFLVVDGAGNLFAVSFTGNVYQKVNGSWTLKQTLPGEPRGAAVDLQGGIYVNGTAYPGANGVLWHKTLTSAFSAVTAFPVTQPPVIDTSGNFYVTNPVVVGGYENHMIVYKSADQGATWTAAQTTPSGQFVISLFADSSDNLFESIWIGNSKGQPLAGAQNWLTEKNFVKSDQLTYEYTLNTQMFQDHQANLYAYGGTYNGGKTGITDTAILRKLECLAHSILGPS